LDSEVPELDRFVRVARNHRLHVQDLDSLRPHEQIQKIQGMLNKAIYNSAENWMKPQWAILHVSEDEDELEMNNTSKRNHIVIGIPGGRYFARCDATGLLNAILHSGSIEFWLYDGDEIIFPALVNEEGPKISLISPDDQVYEWSTSVGSVDFSRLMYHVRTDTSESILNEIHVKNRTLEQTNFTFYVVLRPMSSLGVEPIESIIHDEDSGGLYANGCLAFVLYKKPTAVFMSTADDPNLVGLIKSEQDRCDHDYSTIRGLGTAIVRYDLDLSPAESQEFYIANPLEQLTQEDKFPDISPNSSYRTKTIQSWFEFSRETMSLEIPNTNLQTAYAQAKASLATQAYSEFKTIPLKGQNLFWREKIRIPLALLRIGCFVLVKQLLSRYIEDEDRVETQYEFSIISPLVWMLTQYVAYSKDNNFLEKNRVFLDQWFETIFESLKNLFVARRPKPDIPESTPDIDTEPGTPDSEMNEENESRDEPNATTDEERTSSPLEHSEQSDIADVDSFEEDNVWTSEELLRLIWNSTTIRELALILKKEDEAEISDTLAKCESLILEQLEELSLEPLEFLGILSSISLLNIVDFARTKLNDMLMKMIDVILKDGLVNISSHKKLFSSHHGLRLAHYYCLTNQRYMVEDLLYKATEFLSEYHFLPEFVNLQTRGGSAGNGCSSSAAADLILLLRDLLIYESGEDLVLLSGIPEEWYSSTTPIIAQNICTKSGKATIELGTSANQYQIEWSMKSLPRELEVHVPHSFSMSMIKVFGAGIANRNAESASPNIRIVPLSESVVLTAHK
jgi:hypothetical protein